MYGFTYMRNIKNKKAKVPDRTDKWLLEVRGGKGRGVKWVKGGQNVQTSRYNINKPGDIMYTIYHGDSRFIFLKISLQYN